MRFHNVHGSAVFLTENRAVASRSDNHFCNGIVFGDQPIKSGQKVSIVLSCATSWSGAIRVGVTLNDPAKIGAQELPKYAVPSLAKRDGFWVRPIAESLATDGAHLMFYISPAGHLQFFVNNEHKGALFVGLPIDKPLWILFDLYGNTRSARCIQSGKLKVIELCFNLPVNNISVMWRRCLQICRTFIRLEINDIQDLLQLLATRPRGYKSFFMLNSDEH